MGIKPINRKYKRTRKKIIIGIISMTVGLVILLIITGIMLFNGIKILSPVSVLVRNRNVIFIDNHAVENKAKDLLNKYALSYSDINEEHDILRIQLKDGPEALLAANKNLENQIASLQLLINHFTIEGRTVKKLDLRFDKPVIEFEK